MYYVQTQLATIVCMISHACIMYLFRYLESSDSQVRRPTCRALHRLSLEPENCVTLHQSGAVPVSNTI